jgi:hypothetical protein
VILPARLSALLPFGSRLVSALRTRGTLTNDNSQKGFQ